jgi:hypothetical protein
MEFTVFDVDDQEVLFEGTKQQILDWLWDEYTKDGMNGIEINSKN